ncbi:MAG TPA: GNAT family protein [Actinomycetales bacterium]|nr:GNAT family protein [Actinomycetales bacterium]
MTGWPVVLEHEDVRLRPLRLRDSRAWRRLRNDNADWLTPWEATSPTPDVPLRSFAQMVRALTRQARAGRMLPFAVDYEGELAGQMTVSGIIWGSLRSAQVGYWIDRSRAGRGIIPTALALVTDHCLFEMGLHRMEVNIRPENTASLRVVEKLGFRDEGVRRRYLHIDGDWRDHRTFALTTEDLPRGLMSRWLESQQSHKATGCT